MNRALLHDSTASSTSPTRKSLQGQVPTVRFPLALPAKARGKIRSFDHAAHCLVRSAEERAGDLAIVAAGLNKGVAANLDRVSEIAIAPCRAGANRSRRLVRSPMFHSGEVELPVESRQFDGERSRQPFLLTACKECAVPGDSPTIRIIRQIRQRRRPEGPRLDQTVPRGDAEGSLPAWKIQIPANVKRRVSSHPRLSAVFR